MQAEGEASMAKYMEWIKVPKGVPSGLPGGAKVGGKFWTGDDLAARAIKNKWAKEITFVAPKEKPEPSAKKESK